MARPNYTGELPPEDMETCPICGAPVNMWGRCMEWRQHEDPTHNPMDD